MQAIQIKYLNPTGTRGSRWKATCYGGSFTKGYDHALSGEANAVEAAELLIKKLGWDDVRISSTGTLPNGDYICMTEFVEVAA